MFLSNTGKSFLAAALISTIFGGCGFFKGIIERSPTAGPTTKGGIPFVVKEPEVFQAEFVSTSGDSSTVSFYARKGGNWRFDTAFNSPDSVSLVKTDKMYSISRANKTYSEIPTGQGVSPEPDFFIDMTHALLKQPNNVKFEEAGRNGTIAKYKVTIGDSSVSEAIIYFDESAGMITREEFMSGSDQGSPSAFVFEMRNLKMEVDDSVFAIPADYRRITWTDHPMLKQKK